MPHQWWRHSGCHTLHELMTAELQITSLQQTGFHCDPRQKTPQYVRCCGASKGCFGLLKLDSFWLQHKMSHLGFNDPFVLACKRRDCGAAFPKYELGPNFWEAGLSCGSHAVPWHNGVLLQLEHFDNPVNDAAPHGVASNQLTGWNLLCLAWHWRESIL